MTNFFRRILLVAIMLVLVLTSYRISTAQDTTITVNFYYPAKPDAPAATTLTKFAQDFEKAMPAVKVNLVFAGDYPDIYKALAEPRSDSSPDAAVMLATDLYSLADSATILPLDEFIENSVDDSTYLKDIFPAFLLNAQAFGKTWGAPFQKSTQVLYYNKDAFKAAGLDPDKAPATWQELLNAAKKLTKADGSQWGLEIPSAGFPYWFFQGFAISNGQNLVGAESNKVYFNTPSTVEALQFVADLSGKQAVMPKGQLAFGDVLKDFNTGKAAMIYHTSGSLTGILKNAEGKFGVGVAFLPKGKQDYGAPVGGSNLVIFKGASPEKQNAAWAWIAYLTSQQVQADWTVATGYVAVRQSAWDTATLRALVADKPLYAVAKDQLQYAGKEFSVHANADVQKIFNTAFFAVTAGEKSAQEALDQAQKDAEAVLAKYDDKPGQ